MNIENKITKEEALNLLCGVGVVDIHVHPRDMNQDRKFTIEK